MMEAIRPKELISPTFHKVFDDVVRRKHTHYWLKGGRGSTKSSFISLMVVLNLVESFYRFRNKEITPAELVNVICFRKVGASIRNSILPQIKWAIDTLHLQAFFREVGSNFEFIFIPTGQKIILTGCDDAQKIKSIKPRIGYFQSIWFEELSEFNSMEEIRTILQSVIRGGDKFSIFYSYNPPMMRTNWVNFEAEQRVENRLVHHSSYLDVPREWLGDSFYEEAELLKNNNLRAYEHEYLGKVTGTGGTVFENLEIRTLTHEEVSRFDKIRQGLDFGFSVDPLAFVRSYYDSTRKILYILDEIYRTRLFNDELIQMLKERGYTRDEIIADSEEPKSIQELYRAGFLCFGATKGKGSISYGIKFLQRLTKIVIDPDRTPNAYREFTLYEYEKDKNGEFKAIYPDKNNHCIDAVRYSLERDMAHGGLF